MYSTFKNTITIGVLFVITQLSVFSQAIVYVDAAATGSNSGTSWSNAFTYLVDAVAVAPVDSEIWIAQTTGEGYSVTKSNVKSNRIDISKRVTLIGGFVGNEISKSELVAGQHSIISGEIGDNTLLTDNSNTAFQIKNTHVSIQGILFRKFYAMNGVGDPGFNGAIVADTNSIVNISACSFMQNIGTTKGACISAFKGSFVNLEESSIVNNVQESYASLISRNDDAFINVSNTVFANNGNASTSGYVFYSFNASPINTALQVSNLLNLTNASFINNDMGINYSYFGSCNFKTCVFNLSATSQTIFSQSGDSSTFLMDDCSINGTYTSQLFLGSNIKKFNMSNTHIFNPLQSTYEYFYVDASRSINISHSTFSDLRGSIPFYLYSPNGTVSLDDVLISNSDVSSYMLSIQTKTLTCDSLRLINNKASLGDFFYCTNKAAFTNCTIDGFQGQDVLSCYLTPVISFDKCTIKGVQQSESLFRSQANCTISVTNSSITGISMSVNNPYSATLFSIWSNQTYYLANNVFDNIYSYGNLISNSGDLFVANCTFTNLIGQNSKPLFNNSKKIWVYNSNINSNGNIPFLNDTSYYGKVAIDFSLVNSIVYTQQDTILKNKIYAQSFVSLVRNNISNKSISGPNSVSACAIPFDNLYDDAYLIIYNKGFTPVGINQYPVVDLYDFPRVVDGIIDIGAKEYQHTVTTGIFNNQSNTSLVVYPNPAQEIIHFKSIDNGTMRIVDCNGKEYYTEKIEAGDNVFDIHQLHVGMYFVNITIKDETSVVKLVVVQ